MSGRSLKPYQQDFIRFLLESEVLKFGEFTLKSGRKAPYFINTGLFNSGGKISRLGDAYARHIVECGLGDIDLIFGPAYKGIPLCVATASALERQLSRTIGFSFNRKEAKDHGDRGTIVGTPLTPGTKLVIVEDVISAGTTMRELLPVLSAIGGIDVRGVIIAVDRCERGHGTLSAAAEVKQEFGVEVYSLVTIHDIIAYLSEDETRSRVMQGLQKQIKEYLAEYGA